LVFADAKRIALLDGATVPVLDIDADVETFATKYDGEPLPSADVAEDDPAIILYTSGTSGRPKGAVHSHRNVCAVVEYHRYSDALADLFGEPLPAGDKVHLLAMPLFHVGSLHNITVAKAAVGATVAMHLGAFDAVKVLELVESARVTNWGAVPTMANR